MKDLAHQSLFITNTSFLLICLLLIESQNDVLTLSLYFIITMNLYFLLKWIK